MFSKHWKNITFNNTSEVNFCESDNEHGYFYEFYNTISSLFFVALGVYGLLKNFSKDKNSFNVKNVLHCMMIFVGVLSAYYHAYLSEFSHIMDIISISMIISTSVYSIKMSPKNKCGEKAYYVGLRYGIEMMVFTLFAFISPTLHIIIEFYEGVKLKQLLEKEILLSDNVEMSKKYSLCRKLFLFSVMFWLCDLLLCNLLNGYHFHWIFHILISIMAYELIELLDYFYDVKYE